MLTTRAAILSASAGVCATIALGCSLQDFDYLTNGSGVSLVEGGAGADSGAPSGSDDDGSVAMPANDASLAAETAPYDAGKTPTGSDGGSDARATEAGGPTNYLVNPNFTLSTLDGWTVDPPTATQKYVFTQAPVGSAYTPQGQTYELATYSATDPFTVDVSQTLTGLPDGVYTFSGWFNLGTNNEAYVYAQGCGGQDAGVAVGPDGGPAGIVVNIPLTSTAGWEQVTIGGLHVTGGSCRVGLYVDASPTDWLNADGFSFAVSTGDGGVGDGAAK
jgi:hypothetical protein